MRLKPTMRPAINPTVGNAGRQLVRCRREGTTWVLLGCMLGCRPADFDALRGAAGLDAGGDSAVVLDAEASTDAESDRDAQLDAGLHAQLLDADTPAIDGTSGDGALSAGPITI